MSDSASSGVRGAERVGVVRRALPLRGMDAEAEPPWMGSRRGNALRTAPDPMVPRTPLAHSCVVLILIFALGEQGI